MRPSSVAKQSIQEGDALGSEVEKVMVMLTIWTGTGGLGRSSQGSVSGSEVKIEFKGSLSDVKGA